MSFQFQFSLEILNHLGKGLYRSFASVLAEAISNSWDAEATKVHIYINKDKKRMVIKDNGKGMDADDFQNKFLKVGYSRRDDKSNRSTRKVLGRKGIGKLAMLSVSEKTTIRTKKSGAEETGGCIDNSELDRQIAKDANYFLQDIADNYSFKEAETGTYLEFDGIKDTVNNPEIIKKYLAVLFNFSFSFETETFDIYVNKDKVGVEYLSDLNDKTQYLWIIGLDQKIEQKLYERFNMPTDTEDTIQKQNKILKSFDFKANERDYSIKGYVASVFKPSNLAMRGTNEKFKAGLHLFVNGRLRQEDVFKDIASQRIVESYLYGEIHVDGFDDGDDIFTSNREGIIKDVTEYVEFLKRLKEIQTIIFADWDNWRRKGHEEEAKTKFPDLRPEKEKAIKKFLNHQEDDDLKGKFNEFIDEVLPPKTNKKILITHAGADKILADVAYNRLIQKGFLPEEIIYTSSDNKETRLPINTDIFDYLRRFFVQDWRYTPHVIFIVSANMEASWLASTEAGATWVTETGHHLVAAKDHEPKKPLKIGNLYIQFNDKGQFADDTAAEQIFSFLAEKYGKP